MPIDTSEVSPGARPFGRGALTAMLPPATVAAAGTSHFHPYPTASEHHAWTGLPTQVRERIQNRAAEAARTPWPPLPARLFTDYSSTGTRRTFEVPSFQRRALLRDLVLGTALQCAQEAAGQTPHHLPPNGLEQVIGAIWSICEESSWAVPAHAPKGTLLPDPSEPVLDLFAAETGAQLAWTLYLLGDQVDEFSPQIRSRICQEIEHRVLNPALHGDWHWIGEHADHANNWTPWISSNVFTCLWITSPHTTGGTNARDAAIISRMVAAMDVYLHSLPEDGSCTEGQSYWAVGPARLFDALWQLREASGGTLDALTLPQITEAVRYPVAMHVDERRMIQHSDGPGRWVAEPATLHRWARFVGNSEGMQLAVYLRDRNTEQEPKDVGWLPEELLRIFEPGFAQAAPSPAPAVGTIWFPETHVLVSRQEPGSPAGALLAVKGGHNGEDHNHNDVGSFSIAIDGALEVIDVGVQDYDASTFGPDRYSLWTMRSDWHNLPVVNGLCQAPGREHAADDVEVSDIDPSAERVRWSAELADAWPSEAGLTSWRRSLELNRATGSITLTDSWQARGLQSLNLPLTCRSEPQITVSTLVVGGLQADISNFTAEVEQQSIPPGDRLAPTWGRNVWRVTLHPHRTDDEGSWTLTFRKATAT